MERDNPGEADVVDIYAEKLNSANPRQYYFNGAARRDSAEEVIPRAGAKPVTFEIESTVHGPVIHRENKENVAYTVENAMADNELSGAAGRLQ
ncbi:MAG: penicillin acylase family protein [Sphingomonadales bacterium]|nr:penicillin acylase family protein [Sphingomonadales bacterium]